MVLLRVKNIFYNWPLKLKKKVKEFLLDMGGIVALIKPMKRPRVLINVF